MFQLFVPIKSENIVFADSMNTNSNEQRENMNNELPVEESIEEDIEQEEIQESEDFNELPSEDDSLNSEQDNAVNDEQKDEEAQEDELDNTEEEEDTLDDKVPSEESGNEEVEEEQENTPDNIEFASVSVPEDIDNNGIINQADLDLVSSKYNVLRGQAAYEARYDLNNDGIIDIYDITIVSKKIDTKPVLKGRVTADVLNVRSGPGTGYNKIGTLYYGDVVEILDDSYSSWYKIRYNNEAGFVSSEFVTKYVDYGEAKIIVIDPGHGGNDPGAGRADGPKEKELTLKIGLKVRDMLQSYGYTVIMTRDGDYHLDKDVDVDLRKRAAIANNNNADLFVSIHINSAGPTAKGSETYYHTTNTLGGKSKALATSIQNKLFNYLALSSFNRGVKTADFSVLRNTTMPAVLTEVAFISNPNEEALLITDAFQTKAAKAIVDGILDYLK